MIIITSGSKYIDIDAYASCIAYRELLNLQGIPAKAVTTAKLNESITDSLLHLNAKLDKYQKDEQEEYIIMDVSNKDYFDKIVQEDKITELIDHHVGFEIYWKEKLRERADIELIGAVATIIVERYEKANLLDKMSKDVAYLLMSAILDNTLNFKAKITTTRDKGAYEKLKNIVKNDSNYAEEYFLECQKGIENNLMNAIQNDTKLERVNSIIPYIFSQLTVWDKSNILENKSRICEVLHKFGDEWMMNLICLKEGKSYILSNHEKVKKRMENLMRNKFHDGVMTLPEVWLRKEIIKKSFVALKYNLNE